MIRIRIKVMSIIFCVFCLIGCQKTPKTNLVDGKYEGESRSHYTSEPYWGQCELEIKDGKIDSFVFQIIDKSDNEIFDEKYEKHFQNNAMYIEQCRNDWKGLNAYIDTFKKTKNIAKVDAISGATWSYNIFKDTVNQVLNMALSKN